MARSGTERPIVVDLDFETAVSETSRALHDEGFELVARVDARDQFRIALRHDFRRYMLLEAWSPALAFEALQLDLMVGTKLPVTFAIYELADGETAIIVTDRLSEAGAAQAWARATGLSNIVDDQGERIARVLGRVLQVATRRPPMAPAA